MYYSLNNGNVITLVTKPNGGSDRYKMFTIDGDEWLDTIAGLPTTELDEDQYVEALNLVNKAAQDKEHTLALEAL